MLIIVENLPVPFDTRVWKEAVSLQASGYEVTVLCPQGRGPYLSASRDEGRGIVLVKKGPVTHGKSLGNGGKSFPL